ncbi:MAG: LapA family protein [Blastocatellia bacterium]
MKWNRGPQSRPASRVQGALSVGVLLVLLLNLPWTEQVGAQTAVAPTQWLPSTIGDGTTSIESVGPASLLRSADWRVLEDAAVWKEYGLIDLSIRRYRVEKRVLQVELFRHQTPAGAFGRQSFQRLTRQPGQSLAEFAAGPFFVRLSEANAPRPSSGRTKEAEALDTVGPTFKRMEDALRSTLAAEEEAGPVILKHLPTERRQPNTETYYLGPLALSRHPSFGPVANVLDFTSQPETVTATYDQETGGNALELLLVEYYTPQAATDNLSRLEGYLASLPPEKQARHRLRRIGNYLALIVSDASPTAADQVFNQIRYEQKVYWYGRKVTDIPLEFRPADAAAWREMTNTTTIVVQSLLWIALMLGLTVLIGMLIGGMIFYWRRYQRRKRGIDNLFSDAGETIFLNLDDYLIPPQTEPPAPTRLQLAPLERPEEPLDEPQVKPPTTSG